MYTVAQTFCPTFAKRTFNQVHCHAYYEERKVEKDSFQQECLLLTYCQMKK